MFYQFFKKDNEKKDLSIFNDVEINDDTKIIYQDLSMSKSVIIFKTGDSVFKLKLDYTNKETEYFLRNEDGGNYTHISEDFGRRLRSRLTDINLVQKKEKHL